MWKVAQTGTWLLEEEMLGKSGSTVELLSHNASRIQRYTGILQYSIHVARELIPTGRSWSLKVQAKAWRFSDFPQSYPVRYSMLWSSKRCHRGRSWILPILPISFQLQSIRGRTYQEFRACSLLSSANGGLHQDLIAAVLLCYYLLRRLHSLISDPITERNVDTSQDFPLEGSKCEKSKRVKRWKFSALKARST